MSKGLEAFRTIESFFSVKNVNTKKPYDWQPIKSLLPKECEIVETALKDYERRLALAKEYKDVNNVAKRLKAFEIIKEKSVCVYWLRNGLSSYNSTAAIYELPRLTEKEYELLKEVLDYGK